MGAKYREAEELVLNDLSVMELEDLADLISDVLEIKRHRRRFRSDDDCGCDDCLDDDEEEEEEYEIRNRPVRRGKIAPKYRNPLNTSQIWSGRGMKPRWLVEQISQGRTLDDFLINLDKDGRTVISTPKKE